MKKLYFFCLILFSLPSYAQLQEAEVGSYKVVFKVNRVCGFGDSDTDDNQEYRWFVSSRNEDPKPKKDPFEPEWAPYLRVKDWHKSLYYAVDHIMAGGCVPDNATGLLVTGDPVGAELYSITSTWKPTGSNTVEFFYFAHAYEYDSGEDDDKRRVIGTVEVDLDEKFPGVFYQYEIWIADKYKIELEYYFTPPVASAPSLVTSGDQIGMVCGGTSYTIKANYPDFVDHKGYLWFENTNDEKSSIPIPSIACIRFNNCKYPLKYHTPGDKSDSKGIYTHEAELTLTAPLDQPNYFTNKKYTVVPVGPDATALGYGPAGGNVTLFPAPPAISAPNNGKPVSVDNQFEENEYIRIDHVKCKGEKTGKITIKKIDGYAGNNFYYTLQAKDYTLTLNHKGEILPTFPDVDLNTAEAYGQGPGLQAGKYILKIDNYFPYEESMLRICDRELEIQIKEPSEALTISAASLLLSNGKNISCKGGKDGKITVSGSGGVGPYSYMISGAGYNETFIGQVGEKTFTGLSANVDYTVTVTDALFSESDNIKCPVSTTVRLAEPDTYPSINLVGYNPACYGQSNGSIIVSGKGGSGNLSEYAFSLDDITYVSPDVNGNFVTPAIYSYGAAPVIYMKDKMGCKISSQSFSVPQFNELKFTEVPNRFKQPSCWGGLDGELKIQASGGSFDYYNKDLSVGKYQFSLDGIKFFDCDATGSFVFNNSNGHLIGVGTEYTVIVRDSFRPSCTTSISYSTTFQPEKLNIVKIRDIPPSCPGGDDGKLVLKGIGGTKGGNNYWFAKGTVGADSPDFGYEAIQGDSVIIGDYPTGEGYFITIRDNNNCTQSYSFSVGSKAPLEIVLVEAGGPSCPDMNDGYLKVKGKGGTAAYTFSIDGKLFEGPDADSIYTLSNILPDKEYSIYLRDANFNIGGVLCSTQKSFKVENAKPITINASVRPVSCYNESDGAVVVNSIQNLRGNNYLYEWQDSLRNHLSFHSNLTNVKAGTYFLHIVDSLNCEAVKPFTIQKPKGPLKLTIDILSHETCSQRGDGIIRAYAEGGWIGYKFNLDGKIENSTGFFSNLNAGSHTLTIRDSMNCAVTKVFNIETVAPVVSDLFVTHATYKGADDGWFTFKTTGVKNVLYSVDQKNFKATPEFRGLKAGHYSITVRYNSGCIINFPVNITEPEKEGIPTNQKLQVFTNELIPVSCTNSSDGRASIMAVGGTPPYTYRWSNGNMTEEISNVKASSYIVVVKDNWDSEVNYTVNIPAPDPLKILYSEITPTSCFDNCDGQISVTAIGGTGPYTFSWNDSKYQTTSLAKELCSGTYRVTVTDQNNCSISEEFNIERAVAIGDILEEDSITLCVGQTITLDAGIFAKYEWSSDDRIVGSERFQTVSTTGNYFLKVISDKGCIATDSVSLHTTTSLLKARFLVPSKVFAGDTVLFSEVSIPQPESANWSFEENIKEYIIQKNNDCEVVFPTSGSYTIRLTALLGECKDIVEKVITVYDQEGKNGGSRQRKISSIISLVLFPNPNDGKFYLESSLEKALPMDVKIYNSVGNTIYINQTDANIYHKKEININGLDAGVYLMTVQVEKEFRSIRFIVR